MTNLIELAAKNINAKVVDYNLKWDKPLAINKVKPTHIVIHHDAWKGVTIERIHECHIKEKGWRGVAYNARIRQDGSIELGRPYGTVGGHTSKQDMNFYGLGIVFEGNFMNETMSESQKIVGIKFIKELVRLADIDKVVPHKVFGGTACPGDKFPIDEMLSAIAVTDTFQPILDQFIKAFKLDATYWRSIDYDKDLIPAKNVKSLIIKAVKP